MLAVRRAAGDVVGAFVLVCEHAFGAYAPSKARSKNWVTCVVQPARSAASPCVWVAFGTRHTSTRPGAARRRYSAARVSSATRPAVMSRNVVVCARATASWSGAGLGAGVRRSVTVKVSQSRPRCSVPAGPPGSQPALSAAVRPVAPSPTTSANPAVGAGGADGLFGAHRQAEHSDARRIDAGLAGQERHRGRDVAVAVPAEVHRTSAATSLPARVDHQHAVPMLTQHRGLRERRRTSRSRAGHRDDSRPVLGRDVPGGDPHVIARRECDGPIRLPVVRGCGGAERVAG